jgi:hypothetical protein
MYFRFADMVKTTEGLMGLVQLYDKTTGPILKEYLVIPRSTLTVRPIAKEDVNRAKETLSTILFDRPRWSIGVFVGLGGQHKR